MKQTSKLLLASLLLWGASNLHAATIPELVSVGHAGNAADANGFGSVAYEYSIGIYEVTNSQYAEFLNSVATTDGSGFYDPSMGSSSHGGIIQVETDGSYSYVVKAGFENRPVNFVSYVKGARYANWLTNGGGSGGTEAGAYEIKDNHLEITRQQAAPGVEFQYFIASEDEWYKAAFYDPTKNDGEGGYWLYATQSDTQPTAGGAFSNPNAANYGGAVGALTNGGAYFNSSSYFGTYDQEGNVSEILDTIWNGGWVRRGSAYTNSLTGSGFRTHDEDGTASRSIGFRIVMVPTQIPEPSMVLLLGVGMVGGVLWKVSGRKAAGK